MFSRIGDLLFGKSDDSKKDAKEEKPVAVSIPKYESTEEVIKKKILKILPKDNWQFSKDFFVYEDKTIKEKKLSKLPIKVNGGCVQKRRTIELILRQFFEEKLAKKSQAYRCSSNISNEADFLLQEEKKMSHNVDMYKVLDKFAINKGPYRCHSGYFAKDVVKDVSSGYYFNKKVVKNRRRNMSDIGKTMLLIIIGVSVSQECTRRSKPGDASLLGELSRLGIKSEPSSQGSSRNVSTTAVLNKGDQNKNN
jgi:hypothetical protein